MHGYIEKRGKTYTIRLDLGADPATGVRKQRRISGFKTRREATAHLAELTAAAVKDELVLPKNITTAEYLRSWLGTHKNKIAFTTYRQYKNNIEVHIIPALGNVLLQKLHPMQLQDFFNTLLASGRKDSTRKHGGALSSSTVNYVYRILRCALNDAVKMRLIARNPVTDTSPPPQGHDMPVMLSPTEVLTLLKGLEGTYLYQPVYIAVHTGMRLGEILGLSWDDVDLERGVITVRRTLPLQNKTGEYQFKKPKTKESFRSFAISKMVVEYLKEVKANQEKLKQQNAAIWVDYNLVCCGEDGMPLHPPTVSSQFPKVVRKLGFDLTFHQLRDVYAGLMIQAGVHLKTISANLGHSSGSVTLDRYSGITPAVQYEAAAKIDALLDGKDSPTPQTYMLTLNVHELFLITRALENIANYCAVNTDGKFACPDGTIFDVKDIWELSKRISAQI